MSVLDQLTTLLGADKVLTDEATLQSRRHDYWFLSALNEYQGRHAPNPLCVVRPTSVDDVVATVAACRESGTALITFGLGRFSVTSVSEQDKSKAICALKKLAPHCTRTNQHNTAGYNTRIP